MECESKSYGEALSVQYHVHICKMDKKMQIGSVFVMFLSLASVGAERKLGITREQAGEFLYEARTHPVTSDYYRFDYSPNLLQALVTRNSLYEGAFDEEVVSYDVFNYGRFHTGKAFFPSESNIDRKKFYGKYYGALFDCMHVYAFVRGPHIFVSFRLGRAQFMAEQFGPPETSCIRSLEEWQSPASSLVDYQELCGVAPRNKVCQIRKHGLTDAKAQDETRE